MIISNLHAHTVYSDGINTPLEMIKKAVELNFKSIGFSEHAQCGYDIDCGELNKKDQINYFDLLDSYKKDYPQIQIYKGLELDSLNPTYKGNLDYSIGSIHFIKIDENIYPVDYDVDKLKNLIEICGGIKPFIIKYYEDLINFSKTIDFDIVGHLDLYTKFNEKFPIFNCSEKWYLDIINNVVEDLTKIGKIIEINTGAMARGYRTNPYPDINIFKILKEFNSKIIVSSDAHSTSKLNCSFDYVEALLKQNGINYIYYLEPSGFTKYNL